MKKNFKYILTAALSVLVMFSCQDDEASRFPDLKTGVNARVIVDPERSFINLGDLSGTEIAFDIYSINNDIDRIAYMVTYTDADSAQNKLETVEAISVPASAFVDGKATNVSISGVELAEKLGLPGGVSYYEGGDQLTFTTVAYLKDGRVFSAANSAPSITGGGAASFTTQFVAYVGCPTPADEITSKTYTASITTMDSGGAPPFGLPATSTKTGVTIQLVGPEPFRYRVSSHDAAWWKEQSGTDTEGGFADFYDICGSIIMQPKASFGFGAANDDGGGTYDPATGVITMNWYNAANDIYGFVTYTPEN